MGKIFFNLYSMPTTLETLFLTVSVCVLQDRLSWMCKPKKLNDSTRSMSVSFIAIFS